jgi:hypothetical protein
MRPQIPNMWVWPFPLSTMSQWISRCATRISAKALTASELEAPSTFTTQFRDPSGRTVLDEIAIEALISIRRTIITRPDTRNTGILTTLVDAPSPTNDIPANLRQRHSSTPQALRLWQPWRS